MKKAALSLALAQTLLLNSMENPKSNNKTSKRKRIPLSQRDFIAF